MRVRNWKKGDKVEVYQRWKWWPATVDSVDYANRKLELIGSQNLVGSVRGQWHRIGLESVVRRGDHCGEAPEHAWGEAEEEEMSGLWNAELPFDRIPTQLREA